MHKILRPAGVLKRFGFAVRAGIGRRGADRLRCSVGLRRAAVGERVRHSCATVESGFPAAFERLPGGRNAGKWAEWSAVTGSPAGSNPGSGTRFAQ